MGELAPVECDQHLVVLFRHEAQAPILSGVQRRERGPFALLRRIHELEKHLDPGELRIDAGHGADHDALEVLHCRPSSDPEGSRRALKLVVYPESPKVCVVSVTKYVPLSRAPAPTMFTLQPARSLGRPMQLTAALTISLERSVRMPSATFFASLLLRTGLLITISSRGSQTLSILSKGASRTTSLLFTSTLPVKRFCLSRSHPVTVTDLTWFAVVSVGLNDTMDAPNFSS